MTHDESGFSTVDLATLRTIAGDDATRLADTTAEALTTLGLRAIGRTPPYLAPGKSPMSDDDIDAVRAVWLSVFYATHRAAQCIENTKASLLAVTARFERRSALARARAGHALAERVLGMFDIAMEQLDAEPSPLAPRRFLRLVRGGSA